MQVYNPNNPVYKYKSVKTEAPKEKHIEYNREKKSTEKLPLSYGLYVKPPQYEQGIYKPITYLQYVSFTVDTNDRDYTKYPNPFNFVTNRFSEFFKNIKIFQIYYITLPQYNLIRILQPQDDNYNFMLNFITNNQVTNNQLIIRQITTPDGIVIIKYRICNYYNNEVNFIINDNVSIIYSIDIKKNYYTYGFNALYKLNDNPYVRLNIPELLYLPIMATDGKMFSYLIRTSRARNFICYASAKSPSKVFKENTLLNFDKLTFNFYDSTHQPLSVDYLDKYADPIDDPTSVASKYNYIRHPLFQYHQIIMGVRIGVIRNSLK